MVFIPIYPVLLFTFNIVMLSALNLWYSCFDFLVARVVAMMSPGDSWVARWQRIGKLGVSVQRGQGVSL